MIDLHTTEMLGMHSVERNDQAVYTINYRASYKLILFSGEKERGGTGGCYSEAVMAYAHYLLCLSSVLL